MDEKTTQEVSKKRKDGWIEVHFSFEVMAATPEISENAIKDHIMRIGKAPDTYVFESTFGKPEQVKIPPAPLKEAYSQIAKASLFAKDFYTLLNVILVYGPSAVEVIGPTKRELKIDEMQNISNVVAGLIHEFAAKGVGGMLISSPKQ